MVYSKAIALSNHPRAAPTILVMPANDNIRGPNIPPPRFKLLARDVERRRRHQMIEDDQMLVTPAKWRDRAQVIVIKEMCPKRRSPPVKRSIDQLRRQKQPRRRNLRQV